MISSIDKVTKRMGLIESKDEIRECSWGWQDTAVEVGLTETSEIGVHSYDNLVIMIKVFIIS